MINHITTSTTSLHPSTFDTISKGNSRKDGERKEKLVVVVVVYIYIGRKGEVDQIQSSPPHTERKGTKKRKQHLTIVHSLEARVINIGSVIRVKPRIESIIPL